MKMIKSIITVIIIICFFQVSFGQKPAKNITISGIVLDKNQKPVKDVAVFIDKIKTTSVTDQKGYYKVKVKPQAREIIIFSLFNGYSKEAIEGRTTINFVLTGESEGSGQKDKAGNEIINAGYGVTEKKDMTTNIGKIDGQNPRFAAYQDIYDMLRGAVPGVEVTGKSIKIMGSSSLNVSTEPLFVVDGVIVKSIEDIPPQSVKSIEVLKGAAASVYGSRGANGVILITRLSGKD
jgi:TonB-dependent SusC/RagA subfamily outer membrane receptor